MKANIKTVTILISSVEILKKINSTPALKNLTRSNLVVGENTENVNHYQYAQILRMYPIVGCVLL